MAHLYLFVLAVFAIPFVILPALLFCLPKKLRPKTYKEAVEIAGGLCMLMLCVVAVVVVGWMLYAVGH